MSRDVLSVAALSVVFLTGCAPSTDPVLSVAQQALESPAAPNSGEPFLGASEGGALMSWLEASPEGGHDFRFARYDVSGGWDEPVTIAHSDRFFVNWADFPSITASLDGGLWAHWLQRGEAGGYDYGVRIAHSTDGGATWSDPWTPHDDASPTEHGFVSTVPGPDGVGFAWLDGREYAVGPDGTPAPEEMTVRYRHVGSDGTPGPEMLVDGRVCDCCQTSSAMTTAGPVVVYRNRTEDEIRDIYISRLVDGAWTEGMAVANDGWEIAGCPVNGPAVRARGLEVAVAWFTAAGDVPRVRVAFSRDGGMTFGEPVQVDGGNPAGRVDLVMRDDGSVIVTWLERTGGEDAEVRLRTVTSEGALSTSASLATGSAARASGFPRVLALSDGSLLLAWTDVSGAEPRVEVSRLEVEAGGRP